MIKLQHLRAHILASVPHLAPRNPEQLHTFINDGKIKFARGTNLSHQYTVDAQIVITDYSGSLDTVMVPLLQWLNSYQPDLDPDEAVQLEAELLNNHSWDLALTVRLTERVVSKVDCETGRESNQNAACRNTRLMHARRKAGSSTSKAPPMLNTYSKASGLAKMSDDMQQLDAWLTPLIEPAHAERTPRPRS